MFELTGHGLPTIPARQGRSNQHRERRSADPGSNDSSSSTTGGSSSGSSCANPMGSRSYSLRSLLKINKQRVAKIIEKNTFYKKKQRIDKTTRRIIAEKRSHTSNFKIRKIIKAAERALMIHLSQYERKAAIIYFNGQYDQAGSHQELAILACFGVVSMRYVGPIQPALQLNWGNQTAIQHACPTCNNLNMHSSINPSCGHSTSSNSDPLSINDLAIIQVMQQTTFQGEFIDFLEANGFHINQKLDTPRSSLFRPRS